MRGPKQKPLETIMWTGVMLAANLQTAPTSLPLVERPPAAIAEMALPAPLFNVVEVVRPTLTTIPPKTTTTTSIVPPAQRLHFDPPPRDVPPAESWVPPTPPTPFEQVLEASFDKTTLGEAGLELVGIRQATDAQPEAAFAVISHGDDCATVFVAKEGNLDEAGRLIIQPAFSGWRDGVAYPPYYESQAMFQGVYINHAESAELEHTTPDDAPRIAAIEQQLCNSYQHNLQVLQVPAPQAQQP